MLQDLRQCRTDSRDGRLHSTRRFQHLNALEHTGHPSCRWLLNAVVGLDQPTYTHPSGLNWFPVYNLNVPPKFDPSFEYHTMHMDKILTFLFLCGPVCGSAWHLVVGFSS